MNCIDPHCEKCYPHFEGLYSYEEEEEEEKKTYCYDCGKEIEKEFYPGNKEEQWFCSDCVCSKCKNPPKFKEKDEIYGCDVYECFENGICKKCSK